MDQANNAKINKMLEAAIACADQDGLSNEEMEQIGGIFKTVVSIGKDIQAIFAEHEAIQALTKKFHPQIKELNPLMLTICSAIEKAAAEDDQRFELTLNLK